jgi:hypothetical protein
MPIKIMTAKKTANPIIMTVSENKGKSPEKYPAKTRQAVAIEVRPDASIARPTT